jgi:hypothetical protein
LRVLLCCCGLRLLRRLLLLHLLLLHHHWLLVAAASCTHLKAAWPPAAAAPSLRAGRRHEASLLGASGQQHNCVCVCARCKPVEMSEWLWCGVGWMAFTHTCRGQCVRTRVRLDKVELRQHRLAEYTASHTHSTF